MPSKPRYSNRTRIAISVLVVLIGSGVFLRAGADEKKVAVDRAKLPATIKKAIRKTFPNAQILGIEEEVEGKDAGQFDVEIRVGDRAFEVEISKAGQIKETKEKEGGGKAKAVREEKQWTKDFDIEHCEFSTVGENRYFVLKPGFHLVLENDQEKVEITVLDETVKVGDVETRVVEEREYENGEIKEVSRNFFAICKRTGNVFYFGEDVDEYKDGEVVKHSGAWRADGKDSRAGVLMPGTIFLGARYHQEIAPNALDRAENLRTGVTLKTPAGTFKNCLRTEETSGLDPRDKCYKTYAPGIGLIQDEDLLLTEYTDGRK